MRAARSMHSLPPFSKLALYNDSSAATEQARKNVSLVTSILVERKIYSRYPNPQRWHQTATQLGLNVLSITVIQIKSTP